MKTAISLTTALVCLIFSTAIAAQDETTGGGALMRDRQLHPSVDNARLYEEIQSAIVELGLEEQASNAVAIFSRANAEQLRFPLRTSPQHDGPQIHTAVNFVDLNPSSSNQIRDYNCGVRTYDGHEGIDYLVAPFWWNVMDNDAAEVVAAAGGVILFKVDGNFDRQCTTNGSQDNLVVVLQDDGLAAVYRHLKSGSLTDVAVGSRVNAGDFIGIVGSSGSSTAPHLHFELQIHNPANPGSGQTVDPNAGACGSDQSLWHHQPAYLDPSMLSVRTHFAPPRISSFSSSCVPDQPNLADRFQPGQTAFWAVYLRNQSPGQAVHMEVLLPDNTVFQAWDLGTSTSRFEPFTYWYASAIIPANAPTGNWRVRTTFAGQTLERMFVVGGGNLEGDVRIRSSVLPSSRSVQAGQPATAFATVLNAGSDTALGCSIHLAEPFDGDFQFNQTDPATNANTGQSGALFDIGPGGYRTFVISAVPHSGAAGESFDLSLRYDCANSESAPTIIGLNSIRLSFGAAPTPDVIAIAVTQSQNGILALNGVGPAGVFAVATANVGSSGQLTLTPQIRGVDPSRLTLTICETDSATGACSTSRVPTIQRQYSENETASFAVFARANDTVAFSPASNRIFVDVTDSEGVSRGSTSVAVRTQ